METLNDILSALDKIQGWPTTALVFATCIVFGYALRFIKRFPNDGIPVAVILWGAVFMLLLADPRPHDMPARVWTVRNLLVGLAIGFFAWILHKVILTKLEGWLAARFPDSIGNTDFFQKQQTNSAPPQPQGPPKTP